MVSFLYDSSFLQDDNPICSSEGSDPMGDEKAGLPLEIPPHTFKDMLLRLDIH